MSEPAPNYRQVATCLDCEFVAILTNPHHLYCQKYDQNINIPFICDAFTKPGEKVNDRSL